MVSTLGIRPSYTKLGTLASEKVCPLVLGWDFLTSSPLEVIHWLFGELLQEKPSFDRSTGYSSVYLSQ